jgi:hypothetical protein
MRKIIFLILGLTLFSCGKPTICDCNRAMADSFDGNSFQYKMIREECLNQFGHMNLDEFDKAWKRECQ